jgi:hypothetical protein
MEEDMFFILEFHIDDLRESVALLIGVLNRSDLDRLYTLDLPRQVGQFGTRRGRSRSHWKSFNKRSESGNETGLENCRGVHREDFEPCKAIINLYPMIIK